MIRQAAPLTLTDLPPAQVPRVVPGGRARRRDARLPPQRRARHRAAALGGAAHAHHVPLREGAAHAQSAAADGGRGAGVARAGAGAGRRPLSGVSCLLRWVLLRACCPQGLGPSWTRRQPGLVDFGCANR